MYKPFIWRYTVYTWPIPAKNFFLYFSRPQKLGAAAYSTWRTIGPCCYGLLKPFIIRLLRNEHCGDWFGRELFCPASNRRSNPRAITSWPGAAMEAGIPWQSASFLGIAGPVYVLGTKFAKTFVPFATPRVLSATECLCRAVVAKKVFNRSAIASAAASMLLRSVFTRIINKTYVQNTIKLYQIVK